jgi:Na+-translocating ferredoxin:NAD+ oxidoreductase RnfA subunit
MRKKKKENWCVSREKYVEIAVYLSLQTINMNVLGDSVISATKINHLIISVTYLLSNPTSF